MQEKISVVIITRDRRASLVRTLRELTRLPETFPIVVVDNASADGTAAAVSQQFPRVRVVTLGRNRGAVGRNIGVRAAGTPYVAFCDDDSWWEAGALPRAVAHFDRYPRIGLIAGTILGQRERRLDPVSALQASSPLPQLVPMPGPAILGFLGCGVFVRTSAFLEVGGYNDKLRFSGEEELLGIDLAAAGWGLTYASDLVGCHFPSPERQMPRRYAMGARNRIWAAWLRRPRSAAVRVTLKARKAAGRDGNLPGGV